MTPGIARPVAMTVGIPRARVARTASRTAGVITFVPSTRVPSTSNATSFGRHVMRPARSRDRPQGLAEERVEDGRKAYGPVGLLTVLEQCHDRPGHGAERAVEGRRRRGALGTADPD